MIPHEMKVKYGVYVNPHMRLEDTIHDLEMGKHITLRFKLKEDT